MVEKGIGKIKKYVQTATKGVEREPQREAQRSQMVAKESQMAANGIQKGYLECLWKPIGSPAVPDP